MANMGDNNVLSVSATKEEMWDQAKALRKETEATIALLERFHTHAATYYEKTEAMETKLNDETAKREEADAKLSEATEKMNEMTEEKVKLESEISTLNNAIAEKDELFEKTIAEKDGQIQSMEGSIKDQEDLMVGLKYLRQNIDSFHLGVGDLEEPCGACMLPDGCVIVADTLKGLLKYSPNTELRRHVEDDDWKWPQGLAYDADRELIIVSMAKRIGKQEKFERAIAEFDLNLNLLKTSPGPESASFDNISKEKLALGRVGEIYLSLADSHGSSLWKFMAGTWHQLTARPGAYFADVQVLAQTGPITEVLVTETKKGYIHKFAIRGSDIADRRSMAATEKPGAICVDEDGLFFCQDVLSGKIRLIDNVRFDPLYDVCVVDEAVFSITAAHGYLGAAVRESKCVRIFRYSKKAIEVGIMDEEKKK